jgi:hypothetical protein
MLLAKLLATPPTGASLSQRENNDSMTVSLGALVVSGVYVMHFFLPALPLLASAHPT